MTTTTAPTARNYRRSPWYNGAKVNPDDTTEAWCTGGALAPHVAPVDSMSRDKSSSTGLGKLCRACKREQARLAYARKVAKGANT